MMPKQRDGRNSDLNTIAILTPRMNPKKDKQKRLSFRDALGGGLVSQMDLKGED